MAKYHTEGIVKCLEIEDKQTLIKIDPCPPYKFAEKINGKENIRILCLINDPAAPKTIAVLSETKAKPGIFVNFGDVEDGKIEKGTSFALSCTTKRGHRVFTLQSIQDKCPAIQKSILLDFDISFQASKDISNIFDFSTFLGLKQNRTKIRISISCDPSAFSSPAEITNVKICE